MKTGIDIKFDSGFFWQVALLLLILPLRWVIGFLVAITVHESAHFLVTKMVGIPVCAISVSGVGIKMQTGPMTPWQETIAALAGPVGGGLLLFCGRIFPETAVCAVFHSVFNLLPVYPFDGGRIIAAICRSLFGEERGQQIGTGIGLGAWVFLTFLSITAIKFLGIFAFLPVLLLAVSMKNVYFSRFKMPYTLDK